MNSKNSTKMKSGNSLKKSGRKSNCRKATPSNKTKKPKQENVLGDVHESFIFECRSRNVSYRKIADQLVQSEEFKIKSVDHTTIFDFFKNRPENYKKYLADLKQVRSANAKCRLLELEEIKDKLKEKIIEILGYVPRQWEELNLSSLLSQFVNLMDQIRIDCGDKAKDKNGERRDQTVIQIINTIPGMFADGNSNDTGKENTKARRGFRLDRI